MNNETPETNQAMRFCFGTDDEYILPKVAEKLEYERDQARAEAERWRDNWKKGRTMSMIVSTKLPWENAKGHAPGAKETANE